MISIIVPVYNVEKYLERCVNSILSQTYFDYEIILVNDGSSDTSGGICHRLVGKFPDRIKLIEQANKGQSSARNNGIKVANGEYITFIDSDDYIDKEYLATLYGNIIKFKADVSCCSYLRTGKQIECVKNYYNNNVILEGEAKLIYYLEHDVVSACGKLYRKELFDNIKFPIGKINEDISTVFKVFIKGKRIVYNDSKLYFYYINNSSTTKSKFSEKNLDLICALEEVVNLSNCFSEKVQKLANFRLAKGYFSLLGVIAYNGVDKKLDKSIFYQVKRDILNKFKSYFRILIFSKYLRISRKLAAVLFFINYDMCYMVGRFIRWIRYM